MTVVLDRDVVHSLHSYSVLCAIEIDKLSEELYNAESVGLVRVIRSPGRGMADRGVEGYHLYSAGDEGHSLHFVVVGAVVLYDTSEDLHLIEPFCRLEADRIRAKTHCFGVYRFGEHIGESEFAFQDRRRVVSAFICPSSIVLEMDWTVFAGLVARFPELRAILDKEGALRRLGKEFDALFPTDHIPKSIPDQRIHNSIAEFKATNSLGDCSEEDAFKIIRTLIYKKTNSPADNGRYSKTLYDLHQDYLVVRLIALYFQSHRHADEYRGRESKPECVIRAKAEDVGYYNRMDKRGPRIVTTLSECGLLEYENRRWTAHRELLQLYLFVFRFLFLSTRHRDVEEFRWRRREIGASVWLDPDLIGIDGSRALP